MSLTMFYWDSRFNRHAFTSEEVSQFILISWNQFYHLKAVNNNFRQEEIWDYKMCPLRGRHSKCSGKKVFPVYGSRTLELQVIAGMNWGPNSIAPAYDVIISLERQETRLSECRWFNPVWTSESGLNQTFDLKLHVLSVAISHCPFPDNWMEP